MEVDGTSNDDSMFEDADSESVSEYGPYIIKSDFIKSDPNGFIDSSFEEVSDHDEQINESPTKILTDQQTRDLREQYEIWRPQPKISPQKPQNDIKVVKKPVQSLPSLKNIIENSSMKHDVGEKKQDVKLQSMSCAFVPNNGFQKNIIQPPQVTLPPAPLGIPPAQNELFNGFTTPGGQNGRDGGPSSMVNYKMGGNSYNNFQTPLYVVFRPVRFYPNQAPMNDSWSKH